MTDMPTITTQTEDTIFDLAVFNQIMFAAQQTGLYRSIDKGDSWENIYQSWMPDSAIPTLTVRLSPSFKNDKTVVAGINGGIVLSTDAGATWVIHQFRNPIPMITSIDISPNFTTDQTMLVGTYEDGMFRSVDSGKTWQAFNFGLFDHDILCVAISPDFAEDQTVYAGTSSGIYKSVNGGCLWQGIDLPIGYDAVLSLAIVDNFASDRCLFAGSESQGLLRSDDGGESWTQLIVSDGAMNSINRLADNRILLHVDDTLITSDVDGLSTKTILPEDVSAVTLPDQSSSIIVGLVNGNIQIIDTF